MTKQITKTADNLDDGIKNMIDAMIEDYDVFNTTVLNNNTKMFDEYKNGFEIINNRKYIKVIQNHSVEAFIVKEDFKDFKKGDVLKPASWTAPALNKPRGNVLTGNYPIQWTGPLYLVGEYKT
tara:strand:- start:363 stop:731 length:369 start_codon:yes stop_codon:yes gene_type:complete